ncbi:major facilitator superfamily domain-containing protein [Microdochium bolleyi]|uniref:Major facilitator superfamily domain-containing protein n=1 Tax=Microdochium bolleyi TaxID=196109 RepID=A0A136JA36_9PEZI|nr:major facilitator superfamily domain-containing protein [Microdochium bolleyi]
MTYTISCATRAALGRAANIGVLLFGLLFPSLDASIVNTSLLTISLDLHEFIKAPWVVISYFLAFVSLVIPFAKASDIWNPQRLLLWAWSLFTIGSLGSGLSTSIDQLIFFRALQGFGGSGMYSLAQVGLYAVFPAHRPQFSGACIAITLAISFVLGPVLGGTLTAFATWRWIFYIKCVFRCPCWIYLSILVILPERFQIVNHDGPLIAGVHLLPMLGTTALGSFLAGTICKKRILATVVLILSQFFQVIGVVLILTTLRSADAETKAQNGYQVILGLGIGLSLGSATLLTQSLVPSRHLAVGKGIVAQMQVFGGAVGIAVCSIVYNHTTDAKSELFNASDIELIKNNPVVQQFLPPSLQELTRRNFVESFNTDMTIIFAVALAASLSSLLTLDRALFPKGVSNHGDDHSHGNMGSSVELQSMNYH